MSAENMGELDTVTVLRQKLMESLGDNYEEYRRILRKWFKMNTSRAELDAELSAILNPHQVFLHRQLMLRLIHKCADVPANVASDIPRKRAKSYRKCDRIRKGFEPIDPIYLEVTERLEVEGEVPGFMVHERLLPDFSSALARLSYGAQEVGLSGSHPGTAHLLLIALRHFLKNVLTAVITRKKGFQCNSNGFIHNLGCATPNPWLHNVAKRKRGLFQPIEIEETLKVVRPTERPSREELEKEAIFRLAASGCPQEAGPISLYDLILTLQDIENGHRGRNFCHQVLKGIDEKMMRLFIRNHLIYPGLIASNFVQMINTERIYARLCHPVIDN